MTARISRPLVIAATAAMLTTLIGTSPASSQEQQPLDEGEQTTVQIPETDPDEGPESQELKGPGADNMLPPKPPIFAPPPDPTPPWTEIDLAVPGGAPKFIVEAIGFTAVDETSVDWWGSDEVLATWGPNLGVGWAQTMTMTSQFDGVDSGEHRFFPQNETCIYPMEGVNFPGGTQDPDGWHCKEGGGSGPIMFFVVLYESGNITSVLPCLNEHTKPVPACDDTFIGGYKNTWTEAELVTMLETPGDSRAFDVRLDQCEFHNSDCDPGKWAPDYDFRFRITRMENGPIKLKMLD